MDRDDVLTDAFEQHRPHLRAVAYRMLGSTGEADDAVQEAWLRASRSGSDGVENIGGWLTTIVGRVSLNMLRSRTTRREDPLDDHGPGQPSGTPGQGHGNGRADAGTPEDEAMLADSVGQAMLVVLDTLAPAERLAFVLHDMFAMSFEEIAPIVERNPAATRQLASRARRRVQAENTVPDADLDAQREVVEAFLAAARDGDFDRLVAVLDPDVVLRADLGPAAGSREVRGAPAVAGQAVTYSQLGLVHQPALVNGAAGWVVTRDGRPFAIAGITVRGGRIVEMDFLADPARLRELDLTILGN